MANMSVGSLKLDWNPLVRIGRKRFQSRGIARASLVLTGLMLLFLAAQEVHRTASDPGVSLSFFFNGDTLYPAALCEDLSSGIHALPGWRFTAATDVYPDLLLYAVARWVTGGVAPAMVVCTCLLFALLVLSTAFLLGSLTDRSALPAHLTALLGLAAIYLLLNARCGFENFPLVCPLGLTCHGGSAICVILGLTLVVRLLFASHWTRRHGFILVALFLNTALCMASDRLILVQLIVPAVAAMVFVRGVLGAAAAPVRRIAWIGGVLGLAAVSGQLLLRLIQQSWEDTVQHGQFSLALLGNGLALAAKGTARQLAAGDVLHLTAVGTLAATVAYVVAVGCRQFRPRFDRSAVDCRRYFVAVFFVALCGSSIGAASLSGMIAAQLPHDAERQWAIGTRYFLPVLLLPFLLLSCTLAALWCNSIRTVEMRPWAIAASILAIAGVLLVATQRQPRAEGQAVWNYYPPAVQQLDETAARLGLRDGLGDHHNARLFTMLSRQGLRVRAVMRDKESPTGCSPYPKLGSMHWYRPDRFAPSFIMLFDDGLQIDLHRTPSEAEVVARFGDPAESASAGCLRVLVYHRPEDRFRQMPQLDYRFLRESFAFKFRDVVCFPGYSLPSSIVDPRPLQPRIASEDRERPGVLTDGPELVMRNKGVYRVRAIVTATARMPNGRLEVLMADTLRGEQVIVAVAELPLGDHQEVSRFFTVDERMLGRALFARVYYHGFGALEVHAIEVERSP